MFCPVNQHRELVITQKIIPLGKKLLLLNLCKHSEVKHTRKKSAFSSFSCFSLSYDEGYKLIAVSIYIFFFNLDSFHQIHFSSCI